MSSDLENNVWWGKAMSVAGAVRSDKDFVVVRGMITDIGEEAEYPKDSDRILYLYDALVWGEHFGRDKIIIDNDDIYPCMFDEVPVKAGGYVPLCFESEATVAGSIRKSEDGCVYIDPEKLVVHSGKLFGDIDVKWSKEKASERRKAWLELEKMPQMFGP